jgi:hypothetical protein
MSKRKTTKKHVFTIPLAISLNELYAKYGLECSVSNVTGVDEILGSLSYVDESRKMHHCLISSIHFNSGKKYCCFWDRHQFTTTPIGCPVKYVPSVVSRTYFSEITKDKFTVKESIFPDQEIDPRIEVKKDTNNYYETDGIFCSFNCLYAFIQENKRNPLYADSEFLFTRFLNDTMKITKINSAPHWRLLEEYGGDLNIEEFRKSFSKVEYENRGVYKPFRSIGVAFEEKLKL